MHEALNRKWVIVAIWIEWLKKKKKYLLATLLEWTFFELWANRLLLDKDYVTVGGKGSLPLVQPYSFDQSSAPDHATCHDINLSPNTFNFDDLICVHRQCNNCLHVRPIKSQHVGICWDIL
jgi:hypothetical protein